jgi:hypothetical protein
MGVRHLGEVLVNRRQGCRQILETTVAAANADMAGTPTPVRRLAGQRRDVTDGNSAQVGAAIADKEPSPRRFSIDHEKKFSIETQVSTGQLR